MKYLSLEDGVKTPSKKFDDKDIVAYEVKQVCKKTGSGESDYILEDKCVEVSRVSTKDHIKSFESDVGIMNVLSKYALTGDTGLINKVNPVYGDIHEMPTNLAQADAMIAAGKKAAAEEGIAFTEEALNKFIKDKVAEVMSAKNKEEGAE